MLSQHHLALKKCLMVSVYGWPDSNTLDVARKAKEITSCRRVVLASQLEKHPKCLDQAIQTRKPLGNCFIK